MSSEQSAMEFNSESDFANQVSPPGDDWVKREVFQRTLVLAAAAHQLKTPLAVITGYTDFLLGNNAGPLTETQKNVLLEMQQNAVRLQRFIDNFLNFSALESGKFEVKKEMGDINRCVEETLGHWRDLYAERGTQLAIFSGPSIAADPLRLSKDPARSFQPAGERSEVYARRRTREGANPAA